MPVGYLPSWGQDVQYHQVLHRNNYASKTSGVISGGQAGDIMLSIPCRYPAVQEDKEVNPALD
jgi:hypothetical protein